MIDEIKDEQDSDLVHSPDDRILVDEEARSGEQTGDRGGSRGSEMGQPADEVLEFISHTHSNYYNNREVIDNSENRI